MSSSPEFRDLSRPHSISTATLRLAPENQQYHLWTSPKHIPKELKKKKKKLSLANASVSLDTMNLLATQKQKVWSNACCSKIRKCCLNLPLKSPGQQKPHGGYSCLLFFSLVKNVTKGINHLFRKYFSSTGGLHKSLHCQVFTSLDQMATASNTTIHTNASSKIHFLFWLFFIDYLTLQPNEVLKSVPKSWLPT